MFWNRLQSSNTEYIEEVAGSRLRKQAYVIFSGPAVVERIFYANADREMLFQVNGKLCWVYPLATWLASQNHRRAYITFGRGKVPSELEVYQYL